MGTLKSKSKQLKSLYEQLHQFRNNPKKSSEIEVRIKTLEKSKIK